LNIQLENISKRFGFEWIFKQINFQFEQGKQYAIVGPNGSGKSTLLKVISNGLMPTSGNAQYTFKDKIITDESEIAKHIMYAAPYISLIEDFTLSELYDFHASFRKMNIASKNEFMEMAQLEIHQNKYIKNFSSGMRQRLKLSLAFMTDSPVILLDEPTSNFDAKAIDWYLEMVKKYTTNRLLIIGSNQEYEFSFCSQQLSILSYK
jgi:ABC-type multidrug transport system ATPase subunit